MDASKATSSPSAAAAKGADTAAGGGAPKVEASTAYGPATILSTVSTTDAKGSPTTYITSQMTVTPTLTMTMGGEDSSVSTAFGPATIISTVSTTDVSGNPTTYITSQMTVTPILIMTMEGENSSVSTAFGPATILSTVSTTDVSGNPTTYITSQMTVTPTLTMTMGGEDSSVSGTMSVTSQNVVASETSTKTAFMVNSTGMGGALMNGTGVAATGSSAPSSPPLFSQFMGEAASYGPSGLTLLILALSVFFTL